MTVASSSAIKAIDSLSVHKITSGQVVVDLQTAVKELIENSLDAGATNIEVRFRDYGLRTIEVLDNGSGIAAEDYDSIGLKHHTSKLSSYEDLTSVLTFGFRGEAISSLCAMSDSVIVTTATAPEAPMGTVIELDRNGRVVNKSSKVARQRGTTVTINGLFKPLAVRRKELERNSKREYGKALNLLNAYALVPCTKENRGVRLTVLNQDGGRKNVQIRTDGSPSTRASISALWGPKSLEHLVDLKLDFDVEVDKSVLRRQGIKDIPLEPPKNQVKVVGLISKFSLGCGRTGTDRQFFFINGRPCNPSKVQKAFNEIYRSFNVNQSPFIIADFILPTRKLPSLPNPHSCDINVSPDKRTILLHSEENLIHALKSSLEESFSSSRSTYNVNEPSQSSIARHVTSQPNPTLQSLSQSQLSHRKRSNQSRNEDMDIDDSTLTPGESENFRAEEPETSRFSSGDSSIIHSRAGRSAPVPLFVPSRSPSPTTRQQDQAQISITRARSTSPTYPPPNDSPQTDHTDDELNDSQLTNQNLPGQQKVAHSSPTTTAAEKEDSSGEGPSSNAAQVSSRSEVVKRKEPSKQMVLDTTGAVWNLREDSSELGSRPPKKARTVQNEERRGSETTGESEQRKEKAGGKKIRLWEFALPGSPTVASHESKRDTSDTDDEEMEVDDNSESRIDRLQTDIRVGGDNDVSDEIDEIDELAGDSDQADTLSATRLQTRGLPMVAEDQRMDVDDVSLGSLMPKDTSSLGGTQKTAAEVVHDLLPHDSNMGIDYDRLRVSSSESSPCPPTQELVRTKRSEQTILQFDLSKLTDTWARFRQSSGASDLADAAEPLQSVTYVDDDAGFQNTDEEAASIALSRVIDKDDFNMMEVVGQFNAGFIVARRRRQQSEDIEGEDNDILDDLFIVDQHAADEKYNFEDLQQTIKLQAQKLVHPQQLRLSAADEMLAIENIDILQQNGFDILVNNDEERDPTVPRISLTGLPISKETVFDMKDLEELLHLMQDRPKGQMVRCSKVRSMLAMRACRKSIMVGLPLNLKQMNTVLRHMSTMNQPWNCPHGRPTMRHLCDLSCILMRRLPQVDWEAFVC